ncbi:MAG: hypothetical protein LBT60_05540 [Oscillospiraceae bacterium]|jgi:hypothetical protein|nr:hypothetical protein [Oscillospiraceae bacterium]
MKARRRRRTAAWTLPAAACLILALLLIPPRLGGKDLSQAPDPGTGRTEIALLSEKLPAGCLLTETDYDRDKTVYHIRNARGNPIVLVAEPYVSELPTEGLTFLDLGGATAYAREGGGFCLLRVRQGEAMYTLTSAYSLQDLAEVAMSALAIDS